MSMYSVFGDTRYVILAPLFPGKTMELFDLSFNQAITATATTAIIYATIILYTRIFGLRSFSKMSSYEFAVTVAFGSILASVITSKEPMLGIGLYTMGLLFIIQKLIAWTRERFKWFHRMVDNDPLILMYEGQFLEDNMRVAQVTRGDLIAKLREANVLMMEQVRAVILESTGDVSVLHSADPSVELDAILLEGVRWNPSQGSNERGMPIPDPAASNP